LSAIVNRVDDCVGNVFISLVTIGRNYANAHDLHIVCDTLDANIVVAVGPDYAGDMRTVRSITSINIIVSVVVFVRVVGFVSDDFS
jgi:hypothetical protein